MECEPPAYHIYRACLTAAARSCCGSSCVRRSFFVGRHSHLRAGLCGHPPCCSSSRSRWNIDFGKWRSTSSMPSSFRPTSFPHLSHEESSTSSGLKISRNLDGRPGVCPDCLFAGRGCSRTSWVGRGRHTAYAGRLLRSPGHATTFPAAPRSGLVEMDYLDRRSVGSLSLAPPVGFDDGDLCGGLGFLGNIPTALIPAAFAVSAVIDYHFCSPVPGGTWPETGDTQEPKPFVSLPVLTELAVTDAGRGFRVAA
jgi:hypothetical protein